MSAGNSILYLMCAIYEQRPYNLSRKIHQFPVLLYITRWLLLASAFGVMIGSASSLLLWSLDMVTNLREQSRILILFLPLAGLFIGWLYHRYGKDVVAGNNLLLSEYDRPKKIIPFRMAPLVLLGTAITHLFGGSAGREGTAVQMGGAISDQFTHYFGLESADRRILIVIGIAAGFASVFGTPMAGAIFGLEVLVMRKAFYPAVFPAVLSAFIANQTTYWWGVGHAHYRIDILPDLAILNLLWAGVAGVLFGLTAMLFSRSTHFFAELFRRKISYPPLRPMLGGAVIALAVLSTGTTKYIGLGIPTIESAFFIELNTYDFLIKLLFTAFTLGAGFKGGEVTPLFFIGATLGNALVWFIPLPMALLAGLGFVAVFSGASNTPIASTIMGIELFGVESWPYLAICCLVAYLMSGRFGIYRSQRFGGLKKVCYDLLRRSTITTRMVE